MGKFLNNIHLWILLVGHVIALRLTENSNPDAGTASQKHIQYVHQNLAGISDRGWVFNTLINLGYHFNATVSIAGGANGAHLWLTTQHSKTIRKNWDHYFKISDHQGNPFHDLRGVKCHGVSERTKLSAMFDSGSTCVKLTGNMYSYSDRTNFCDGPHRLAPSQDVLTVAEDIRRNLMKDTESHYGLIHVRRCDRMNQNSHCTDPDRIFAAVESVPKVKAWVVFMYAEHGYKENLFEKLQALPNHTFQSEDDLKLFTIYPDDTTNNYFRSMVMNEIAAKAAARVETHECNGKPTPSVTMSKIPDQVQLGLEHFDLERLRAVCGGRQ